MKIKKTITQYHPPNQHIKENNDDQTLKRLPKELTQRCKGFTLLKFPYYRENVSFLSYLG